MPPPFRFTPFPFRTSPFLFLVLFFFLFALPACPEPPIQSDGSSENTEGGVEQTDVPEEAGTPEESANPEESVRPEREPLPEYQIETPEVPDTTQPTITAIEGDGEKRDVLFPTGQSEPNNAKKATLRFRTAWHVLGVHLSKIDSWTLQSQDKSKTFPLTILEKKDTNMKLALPTALTIGFFTLIGLIGNTPSVQAEVFVLQGEKGDKGETGATGATGKDGVNGKDGQGFDTATLTFVNALKSAVTVTGTTLTFKAETITVETKTFTVKGTKSASFQFDDDKQTITVNNANLQVTSGSGTTDGTVNGFGNIIIGYNENTSAKTRTGSHNLILGTEHGYSRHSSILSGSNHTVNAPYASAIGGSSNNISAPYAATIGGSSNTINANAPNAVSVGGLSNRIAPQNTASYAVSVGGEENEISADYAAAVAGQNNSNTGTHAAAVAGQNNSNTGTHAAAVAGQNNSITASHAATLAGGGSDPTNKNTVSAPYAAAVAGQNNKVEKGGAAAVAGQSNTVGGNYAAAVAGQRNAPNGSHSAIIGGGGPLNTPDPKNQTVVSHTAILGGQNNAINASSKSGVSICGSFGVIGDLTSSSCCKP